MEFIVSKSKRLQPSFEKTDEVFKHYEKYVEIIQKGMWGGKEAASKEDNLLDHHKIAAALCCSVIKAKPISFIANDSDDAPTNMEKTANEFCAFLLGLQVIQNFWSFKCYEDISAEDMEIYNKPIKLPPTNDDDTTYIEWFIKLISGGTFGHFDYENNLFGGTLIFYIAHIYFLIEGYSYQYYKGKE